jgi:membrane-associated protease RseP (regulator of RpoE activity)
MSGLLLFLILLNAYLLLIYVLHKTGRLGSSVQLAGPLLMFKTQRGKPTIERISKARKLWLLFGDAGIVLTWIAGLLVFALLIFQLYKFITEPVESAANSPDPQFLIGLPGVNPLIPLWYGIFGLIVALVVHEGCHGILARAQDLKVKSLGILLLVVPVGAFVEPDEKDLEKASARAKNRVFAAGPMSNLVLAFVTALLFSGLLMSSAAVVNNGEGVGITGIAPGLPAEKAGLLPGDVVYALNGEPVRTAAAFAKFMNGTHAGDQIRIDYLRDGERRTATATLIDKYDYIDGLVQKGQADPAANRPYYKWKGFLGVGDVPLSPEEGLPRTFTPGGLVGALRNPVGSLQDFSAFISYPFFILGGLDVFEGTYSHFIVYEGGAASVLGPTGFIVAANALYWLFWLNLMLGTFNALPAGPLDGGQMFRTTLKDWLMRFYRVDPSRLVLASNEPLPGVETRGADPETQAKLDRIQAVTKRATWSLGLFILALLLLPIVGRQLVGILLG